MKRIVLLLFILASSSQLYSAETRYIRDELYVPLRSGQTTQHRIVHKGLVSGTPLTIIAVSDDKLYSQVRTSKGIEGWIQTQYLSDSPAGRDLLKVAERKLATLQEKSINSTLNNEMPNNNCRPCRAAAVKPQKNWTELEAFLQTLFN